MPRPPKEVRLLREQVTALTQQNAGLRRDLDGATNELNVLREQNGILQREKIKLSQTLYKVSSQQREMESKLDQYARLFTDLAVAYNEDHQPSRTELASPAATMDELFPNLRKVLQVAGKIA